jgi:hypothetical protein
VGFRYGIHKLLILLPCVPVRRAPIHLCVFLRFQERGLKPDLRYVWLSHDDSNFANPDIRVKNRTELRKFERRFALDF